jgi:hypothetical protein
MIRVAHKILNFVACSKYLSIDYAVLGTLPNRLLFTMLRNVDFTGSVDTNPTSLGISFSTTLLCT